MINNNKVFVCAITQTLLQLNDFQNAVICELALRLNKFLPLLSIAPEESRVDLGFFVFEGHIEAHDVAIFEA